MFNSKAAFCPPGRVYFLDQLRNWAIINVVAYHSCFIYAKHYSSRWYFTDRSSSPLFDAAVIIGELYLIPSFFFVAGYFAEGSLVKAGPGRFLIGKIRRVILPFLVAIMCFMPLNSYLASLAKGEAPGNYALYWFRHFLSRDLLVGHLWFLPVLFAFFVILTAVWLFEQHWLRRGGPEAAGTRPREISDGLLVVFGLLTTICLIVLSCFYDYGEWRHLFGMDFLSYQPSRVYVDMCYFFLGIYLRRKRAFLETPTLGRIARWLIAAAVLSVIFLWFRRGYGQFVESSSRLICINAFLHCMTMLSLFAAALFGCRRWLNFSNKSTQMFSANSFTIYLIHQPLLVVPLQYALLGASTNCYMKFAIVFAGSLVLSFLMSHFVLRRVPGLQAIL